MGLLSSDDFPEYKSLRGSSGHHAKFLSHFFRFKDTEPSNIRMQPDENTFGRDHTGKSIAERSGDVTRAGHSPVDDSVNGSFLTGMNLAWQVFKDENTTRAMARVAALHLIEAASKPQDELDAQYMSMATEARQWIVIDTSTASVQPLIDPSARSGQSLFKRPSTQMNNLTNWPGTQLQTGTRSASNAPTSPQPSERQPGGGASEREVPQRSSRSRRGQAKGLIWSSDEENDVLRRRESGQSWKETSKANRKGRTVSAVMQHMSPAQIHKRETAKREKAFSLLRQTSVTGNPQVEVGSEQPNTHDSNEAEPKSPRRHFVNNSITAETPSIVQTTPEPEVEGASGPEESQDNQGLE